VADTTTAPAALDTTVAADTSSVAPDTLATVPDTTAVLLADSVAADTVGVIPLDSTMLVNSRGAVRPDEWFVLTARVDTTDADVRAVMRAWRAYMVERYDGSDGAHLWYLPERERWGAFNLFAPFVFNAPDFFGSRRATVLSAERAGDRICVRTMFDERSSDGTTSRLDPWAIVRVFFEKQADQWWIRNALGIMTEDWMRSRVRFITFVYPRSHIFSLPTAMRAAAFCDSIAEEFPFLSTDPFELYIGTSTEEVDRLLGMDYYVASANKGVAMPGRGLILTSGGTEWNPREMLQMLMRGSLSPHPVVSRGFAGWMGGWDQLSFRDGMRNVAQFLKDNPNIEFDDLIKAPAALLEPGLQYAPGAVLCDLAWARGGNDAVFRLFNSGPTDESLYATIEDIFGVDSDRFQFMWRARVRELR